MNEILNNKIENKEDIKIIYTAEFVKDIQELVEKFPPIHEKVLAHHSTIAFRPKNLAGIKIGKESKMKIIGRIFDEKIDVLLVENPKCTYKFPHITLSAQKDVSPVYANDFIEKFTEENGGVYFSEPYEIDVVEGYFNGEKDVLENNN